MTTWGWWRAGLVWGAGTPWKSLAACLALAVSGPQLCIQRTMSLVREGKARSFAPIALVGGVTSAWVHRDGRVRRVSSCSPLPETNQRESNPPQSLCLSTGSLTSRESSPGWGTLMLLQCPQLILCLYKCLDLPGALQVGGWGEMAGCWEEVGCFLCRSCVRSTDVALCHLGLVAAGNPMALPA